MLKGVVIAIGFLFLPYSVQAASVQEMGRTLFENMEAFRVGTAEQIQRTVSTLKEERAVREAALKESATREITVEAVLTDKTRPQIDKVRIEDSSGIGDGLLLQILSPIGFIFGSPFIFYPLSILILFFLLRIIFRRVFSRGTVPVQ